MSTNTNLKIEEALKDAGHEKEFLKVMDEKQLVRHLKLYRQKIRMACQHGNHAAYHLEQEYERLVLISIFLKLSRKPRRRAALR